jgi:tetratricopeptide (TPR) repeat protein
MPENHIGDAARAKFFFDSARKAAGENNFDFAVDMYLEGLRRDPNAVEQGHIKLREVALQREETGGQKPSEAEAAERLKGKTPLEQMINAEYLLAKDPSHLPYAEGILKAAAAGGYKEAAKWIGDLMFLANNGAKKPSLQIYLLLKDSYAAIGEFDRAVAACECALRLKPKDAELEQEFKKLSEKHKAARAQQAGFEEPLKGIESRDKPDAGGDTGFAKACVFFERARKVADANDFDYAIDMYLEGLRHAPDAVHEGHCELYELALHRKNKGGKKPSMMERVKRLRGKNHLEQMLNAEYLLAKDPSHLAYAGAMLKAAIAGECIETGKWVADLLFQANNTAKRPSFHTYILLKDSYAALGQFERALAACRCAARLKPEDANLADQVKNLTAEMTVSRGRYDQEGDFRGSIKDRETQEKLQAQESIVKTQDYRTLAVQEARKALAKNPNLPNNIFGLAQALSDFENDKADKEAIQLLENAYRTKSDFSFRQRAGQIRMKQLRRKILETKRALQSRPDDVRTKAKVATLSEQLNNTELEHYRACVENYPTDMQAKYEYGIRLVNNKQYDEAIPYFQEAERDPRHKIPAMNKVGFCFFMKGWFTDAVDVFTQAIDAYRMKDDNIAKELRYNLARAYEEQGENEKALDIYRKIAQLDFSFKDVHQRVDKLRKVD